MKHRLRRLGAWGMSLLLLVCLSGRPGRAASSGVYFTAANDQLLDLNDETMPFYSNGVLYVSSRIFEESDLGDLGVSYARSSSLGLAMLYSGTLDLRFDLAGQVAYDKQGNLYSGYAIERGGVVFFPLNLVCRYFGLTWTYTETDMVPLIRVKSSSVILSDSDFVYAATRLMRDRYDEYGRTTPSRPSTDPGPTQEEPPIQAAEGQKVYLLFDGQDAAEVLPELEDVQATFLLTGEQMEDGDLLRALVAGGHAVALRIQGETEEDAAGELRRGQEALWRAACSRLELAWYDGEADLTALFTEQGCVPVRAQLSAGREQAMSLLRAVGQRREDVSLYWGGGNLAALPDVLEGLKEGRYHISAWRLTA